MVARTASICSAGAQFLICAVLNQLYMRLDGDSDRKTRGPLPEVLGILRY
jgi:hypothetical protein